MVNMLYKPTIIMNDYEQFRHALSCKTNPKAWKAEPNKNI